MSSQLAAEPQPRAPMFAEQKEAEGKSKPRAGAAKVEPTAVNEPDEFETRRRQFFAGTKNAS